MIEGGSTDAAGVPKHDDTALYDALKQLILVACNRPETADAIDVLAPLAGPDSSLGLDSLDILQISLALTQRYGVRLEDSKAARRALKSVATLASFLREAGAV